MPRRAVCLHMVIPGAFFALRGLEVPFYGVMRRFLD